MPIPRTLLKKSEIRRRILEIAADTRAHGFTRVSADTYIHVEEAVERVLQSIVARQPSRGKTIQP